MNTEHDVAAHYFHGALEQALLSGVAATGKDVEHLSASDLMGADEFHVGGAQATNDLASRLHITPEMHLLDLGSGLGGPARHLASAYGCRVTGIDLSEEYVGVAESLTRRMGLSDRVDFRAGSVTSLPFAGEEFDGATLLHVGMNVADKRALCAGVFRVLRPGAFFAVYDVMRASEGDIVFPVPWSSAPETSFVEPADTYRTALAEAGFSIVSEQSRAAFALEFFAAMRARQAQAGQAALGLPVVMGPAAPQKIANMITLIKDGVIAPTEIIARR